MYEDLDMSGEEIAAILKQEEKRNVKLYKLTITKVIHRTAFIRAISNIYSQLSFQERLELSNNLPFVDNALRTQPAMIKNALQICCEFSYEEIPFPGNDSICTPPWESPKYLEAKSWMETLPLKTRKEFRS